MSQESRDLHIELITKKMINFKKEQDIKPSKFDLWIWYKIPFHSFFRNYSKKYKKYSLQQLVKPSGQPYITRDFLSKLITVEKL